MTLHKEGYRIVWISSLLFVCLLLFVLRVWPGGGWWGWGLSGLLLLLQLWIVSFFRSPRRSLLHDPRTVVSPADGRVVVVEEVFEADCLKADMIQLSVFMSPLNVHVNRYPFDGLVQQLRHEKGRYLFAWHPKSSRENERTSLILEDLGGRRILLRQIAGFLARRIVCYAREGGRVRQGEELGFIKFGSRVDLFLPVDCRILVRNGDRVRGGITPLATMPAGQSDPPSPSPERSTH